MAHEDKIITKRGPMPGGMEALHYAIEVCEQNEDELGKMAARVAATEAAVDPEKNETLREIRASIEQFKQLQAWARAWDEKLAAGSKFIPDERGRVNNEWQREFGLYLLDIASFRLGNPPGRFESEHFKRAQTVGTADQGGYLVAPEQFAGVHELAERYGLARQVLSTFEINSSEFRIPTLTGRPTVYFPNEGAAPGSQSQVTFGRPTITPKYMVAFDRFTMQLDKYTAGFIGSFLTKVFMVAVTQKEDFLAFRGKAAAEGGTDPFSGLLFIPGVTEYTMPGGSTEYKNMGYDDICDLMDTPNPHIFTEDPIFVWSNSINIVVRKIKGTDGQPLAAQMVAGNPPRLFDSAVRRSEVMPRQSDSSQSGTPFGLFGDLKNHAMGISKEMAVDFSPHDDFTAGNVTMRVTEWLGYQLLIGDGIARILTA